MRRQVRTHTYKRETPVNSDPQRVPRLVNTREAAEILGRSPATLKRWRYEGIGPDYVEMERRVSYDVAVLLEYIRQNTRVPSVRAAMEEAREAL
jgi:phage terminase Nu1 subunit (DNA packaging protein)